MPRFGLVPRLAAVAASAGEHFAGAGMLVRVYAVWEGTPPEVVRIMLSDLPFPGELFIVNAKYSSCFKGALLWVVCLAANLYDTLLLRLLTGSHSLLLLSFHVET